MRPLFTLISIVAIALLAVGRQQQVVAQNDAPPLPSDGTLRQIDVPVLMYHYVGDLPDDADVYRVDLTVQTDVFRSHMAYLQDNGYTTISLYDIDGALRTGKPLPPKPVVLTFDDGHLDHYVNVLPILQEFGFTGTFFVITGLADQNHPQYMSWAQIQELAEAGMSVEPHSKTHISLSEQQHDRLVYEILGSMESVAAYVGETRTMFAYPAGRYDRDTLAVMEALPYRFAVTTQIGTTHSLDTRLETPRLRVSGDTSASGLAYLLNTDWNP